MPVEGKGQETRSDHWISGSFQGLGPYLYTFGLHLQQRLGKGRSVNHYSLFISLLSQGRYLLLGLRKDGYLYQKQRD